MTNEGNYSSNGISGRETLHTDRELIVVAKSDAGLRVRRDGVASVTGTDVATLSNLLNAEGVTLQPLFGVSEERLQQRATAIDDTTPRDVPDLSVYYRVQAPDEQLDALAERLRQQDVVEAAYVKPAAELAVAVLQEPQTVTRLNDMLPALQDAPPATPDFTTRQGYLNAAPVGIDARYAWTLPGGRGAGVNIIDLEWGWNFSHEDLRDNQGGIVGGVGSSEDNHGTAVLGEMSGDRNSFGITGICPDANVSAVAFSMPTAAAIRLAADRLRPGDIMLLEIHRPGPRATGAGQQGFIAIEWWPDDFDAIRYAVSRGVIVVEAAGNGAENLDDAIYNTRPTGFPASWRNPFNPANPSSGAVVVGAGAPPSGTHGRDHGPDRSRLDFSNYGARIDAQGWGREVTTTGYGDLQGGTNRSLWYTDTFSGTSSASPIVTGALACVQGILRARSLPLLNSEQARQLLRSTGSPQQDAPSRPRTQRIGHRPNLRLLISHALFSTPGNFCGVWRAGNDAHYLWVNASWESFKTKWQELSQNGLRLERISVRSVGNSARYSGVWRAGNDAHYLWVNASWESFKTKWQELSQNGLRLVDFHQHFVGNEARYSGVWRAGSDAHYLWVNADWLSFWAKWQELSQSGLRLRALSVNRVEQSNRYSGVWRAGNDAHYLWLSTTWSGFESKWQELSRQGLRLTNFVQVADSNSQAFAPEDQGIDLMEPFNINEVDTKMTGTGDGGGEFSYKSATAIGNGKHLLFATDLEATGNGGGELFDAAEQGVGDGGGELPLTAMTSIDAGESLINAEPLGDGGGELY